jgi:hypothetical protein
MPIEPTALTPGWRASTQVGPSPAKVAFNVKT